MNFTRSYANHRIKETQNNNYSFWILKYRFRSTKTFAIINQKYKILCFSTQYIYEVYRKKQKVNILNRVQSQICRPKTAIQVIMRLKDRRCVAWGPRGMMRRWQCSSFAGRMCHGGIMLVSMSPA